MEVLGLVNLPGWFLRIMLFFMTVCLYTLYKQSYFKRLGIPTKPTLFFLGDIIEISKKGLGYIDEPMVRQNGKVFGLYSGNIPTLVISDTEIIKQIMVKEFSKFADRAMCLYIHKCMDTFHEVLEENIQKNPDGFDIAPLLSGYTLDVICSTVFGMDIDAQRDIDNNFIKYSKEFLEFKGSRNFAFIFYVFFPDLVKVFNIKTNIASNEAFEFFMTTLTRAFQERRQENSGHRDLLQLLINAHKGELGDIKDDHEASNTRGEMKRRGLTDEEVLINSLIFMLAGYDTTAATLQWIVYDVVTNPDCQQKLVQEIDDLVGDTKPNYDNVLKLPYLDMVVNETLRMHPPANRINRAALQDIEINGVQIKKGMDCTFSTEALHYMPEYWDEPKKYNPERFAPENKSKIDEYAFMPFGRGPRNCIGKRLALLEIKAKVVFLLQKYRFQRTDKLKVPMLRSAKGLVGLGKPDAPVFVKLQRR